MKRTLLPSVPEPMDEALERMVLGFLDHEMGQVAFSDFHVLKASSERLPADSLRSVESCPRSRRPGAADATCSREMP
jgi:hypothetical protein